MSNLCALWLHVLPVLGHSGFLSQFKDLHCSLIGISKLSIMISVMDMCECVQDSPLLRVSTMSRVSCLVPRVS